MYLKNTKNMFIPRVGSGHHGQKTARADSRQVCVIFNVGQQIFEDLFKYLFLENLDH